MIPCHPSDARLSLLTALALLLVADGARADDAGEPPPTPLPTPLPSSLRGEPEVAVAVTTARHTSEPHGTPLPRRPAGNASASFEYTRIGNATVTGTGATYALGQHAVVLPKDGVTVHMEDVVLGGAAGGGFVYQTDSLFGLGRWLGGGGLGIAGGIGVDGITGHRIPIGMRLPVRAWGTVNLGPAVRLEASGEIAWIAWTAARRGRGAAVADELVGRVGIYIAGRGRDAGCFVGFTMRQALGTTLLTFGLGVGLAAAAID